MSDSSSRLPRLLDIGDLPVNDTFAGGTFLFRLLRSYPSDKLCVIGPTTPDTNRLPGVAYHCVSAPMQWLFRTRVSGLYSTWVAWRYQTLPRSFRGIVDAFRPEATLSVSQTGGWMMAWRLAMQAKIPFHLIVHDDRAYSSYLPSWARPWAEQTFALAYRDARSRFCISPAMAETYANRYGVPGLVLYPFRHPLNPVADSVASRTQIEKQSLTIAYAGSIHGNANLRQLAEFATIATIHGHRLLVFSPQYLELKSVVGNATAGIDIHAPLSTSAELLCRLREEADCLLVTGSFDPDQHEVVSTLFPSKVADYSATGLPILSWAPDYASITRFFSEHPSSAEVVTTAEQSTIGPALGRLTSAEYRRRLSENIIALGRRFFSPEAAWKSFSDALCRRVIA